MFSLVLHQDRRKSYPSSIHKWLCKQASSHLSLWTSKSIAFAKDFLPEKTCKLLRRLLYRNGFVLCSILASPIFVWRNGVWQRRRLFHRPYPRFPNLYRCKKIQKKERKCSSKAIFGGASYNPLHGLLSVRKSLQKAMLSAAHQSKWGEACLRTICGWAAYKIFVRSLPREH